jgi:hypothetical protein
MNNSGIKMIDNELVGKKFKRKSKYGLSIFTGTIKSAHIVFRMDNSIREINAYEPIVYIESNNGIGYNLDEIVFV